jgi:hypothetical protein
LEGYSFHEAHVPSEEHFSFEPSLYNYPAHRFLQSAMGWHSFYILEDVEKKVVACVHFNLFETNARSPFRSPFGSIEFNPSLPADVLYEFIRFFEIRLKSKGATSIAIKNYPNAYGEKQSILLQTFLSNYNYTIVNAELASVIDVTGDLAEDSFHRSEQKRLSKATQAGLTFQEIHIEDFNRVYQFIETCRNEKQYTLSMPMQDLKDVIQKFPGKIVLFGVLHDRDWAAASISIRVRNGILYDFYHDHTSRFDNLSPVVLLVAGIYDYCQRHQIEMIDLGTSMQASQPNFDLLRFKKNLGARFSPKLTFEKTLV